MAQEGAQGPQAPEPAVSQPLPAPRVEGAPPRGKWASVGGAEVPERVGTGEPKGALQGVPGPSHQPAAEGAGGGSLGVRASAGRLLDGRGPGGQPKEPLPPLQPQASARAPRPLGDVLPWVRGLL